MASIPDPRATRSDARWKFLAPPQKAGELGRLGSYRVLKLLGQGGMGMVFQAEDVQLRRLTALKVMHPHIAVQEQARARFLREARAAAALKHDHVVTIYQVGEERGVPFLAMEFLAGKSLEEWLRPDRQASIQETITIAKQIARGLAAAHGVGLIHRDIKPANLWLEAPRGRVKILDFGLARPTTDESTALTQDGALVGTPAFMAPEQARGEKLDPRCDLFSLGCVLYRMATGRLPFQGNTVYAALAAVASQTPPGVRTQNPAAPPRLEELINRLLAKSPDARPASAQAVVDELQQIERDLKLQPAPAPTLAEAGATAARTQSAPWVVRRPSWIAGFLGLVALVAAGLFVAFASPQKKEQEAPAPQQPPAAAGSGSPSHAPAAAVDLIPLIDVKRDGVRGKWWKATGLLRGHAMDDEEISFFSLVLPWEPPSEYRLKLTATRLIEEHGYLSVGLAAGSARFGLVFDLPWKEQFFTGLSLMDGQFVVARPDARMGRVLPAGLAVNLVCAVLAEEVTVKANGREIYQWRGDLKRLSRGPRHPTEPLYLFGANKGSFTFEDILLEPLGPSAGRPLADRK
jgi:predicted Ser/Thr protein kinase